ERGRVSLYWCRRPDSNRHGLPHTPLKRTCLPIPPRRHGGRFYGFGELPGAGEVDEPEAGGGGARRPPGTPPRPGAPAARRPGPARTRRRRAARPERPAPRAAWRRPRPEPTSE